MTLLIVFLALTNMAVGYGLAIYFAKGGAPIQMNLGRFRQPKAEADLSDEATSTAAGAPSDDVAPSPTEKVSANAAEAVEPGQRTKPIPEQVPQLDVSDLTAEAQAPADVAEPEPTADQQSDAQVAVSSDEQADEPLDVEAKAESVEATEQAPAVAEAEESHATEASEIANADSELEVAQTEEVDELESLAQMLQSAAAASSDDPGDDADDTESIAAKPANVEEAAGNTEDSGKAETENVVVQHAEPSVHAEVLVDAVESKSVAEQAQVSIDSSSTESADDVMSGLAAFQQQLNNQAEQSVEAIDLAEPTEPLDDESAESADPVDDAMRAGIEAFQSQLQEQADQAPEETLEEQASEQFEAGSAAADQIVAPAGALEGIEAFQSQLQEQANLAPPARGPETTGESDASVTSGVGPEVLAGIESFRSQLAQMRESPEATPKDATDQSVEPSAAT